MKTYKLIRSIILAVSFLFCMPLPAMASELNDGAQYLIKEVQKPEYGAIGGEWTVTAVWNGASQYPKDYFENYYANIEKTVKKCKGVLSEDTYTEYSRVVIALECINKNPKNVAGYDLAAPLMDYDKVSYQGINGVAYALLALDAGRYTGPRIRYIDYIINSELPDGGWNLFGKGDADPDMTAMVLRAIAPYRNRYKVKKAIDSSMQVMKGNLSSSESISQCILAYDALQIDSEKESLKKELLRYQNHDGGFKHSLDEEESNIMSTEQALMALSVFERD